MKPIKPEGMETPGLVWQRRSKRQGKKIIKRPTDPYVGYWVCRDDIVDRGYSLKTQRLWPPADRPYVMPTGEDWEDISASCERLQSEMLAWANGSIPVGQDFDARRMFDGTFGSLVDIFLNDPDSPFHKNRFHTRKTYRSRVLNLKRMIGLARITPLEPNGPKITFRDFNRWAENWSKPKKEGGSPRPGRAHGYMSFVRILLSFGAVSELPRCEVLHSTILSKMEFKTPKKRTQIVNREQAVAIIAEAHRRAEHSIAFAQAMMFSFMVRQKDVVGEWIPIAEPGLSSVIHHGMKWMSGFTWEEIESGVLDHRLSKSLRGRDAVADPAAGKPLRFTLALHPLVLAEIDRIPVEQRCGPMVKAEHSGLPWNPKVFAAHWREIARAASVPDEVQNRDTRAGAGTEAKKLGATREDIRPAFGHAKVETSDIYLRDKDGPDNIARLRFGTDRERDD
jgi:hypothetical protein